ncbi:MAG TPA: amino acid permease [Acidimicrobiia bacterium]|jgi:amino acid transporter
MSIDPTIGEDQAVLDAAERDLATPAAPALGPDSPVVPVVPESRLYRAKMRLLGQPLSTETLEHQRLGKPTALAVFASDNLSSAAYGTEEILRVLVPVVGVAAFSLVIPVTTALLVVLGFLILSYRQTIKEYPSAGGAYIVTKDNLGKVPSLVAGVSLLTDYILTVAVSVAAGTAALASAVPALVHIEIPLSILFVMIIAYGNLRGVKESGRVFAIPTYFFLFDMAILLGWGLYQLAVGHLPVESLHAHGLVPVGTAGDGLLYGAALFVVLRAFASGGAAVTGVEAISNGVPAFREPAWKNARTTLVIMGTTLGVMFLGLSTLAAQMHVAPYKDGTPTVISQVGKLVYGTSPLGHTLFYLLQIGTLLILILAANTSFADFPRLASFAAADHFMPRQLTKRGHRLVFSNGIIMLAGTAIVVLLATEAKVSRLIPLYAIGVFTSFTLSQVGMAKHHIRRKEPGWRRGLFINGTGAAMTAVVTVIIAVTKFTEGGWVIIVAVPILVLALLRLNRAYTAEGDELLTDAKLAAEAPILRRHVVLVFLGSLDLAGARALQYARALTPDEMRAVHFAVDIPRANALRLEWLELGLTRIPLEIVACEDRRITRAAVETVAETLADGKTEVTILLPRIEYNRPWHRILHDRTSRSIASVLSDLPHANVTFVPYQLGPRRRLHFDEATLAATQRLAQDHDVPTVAGPVAPIDHAEARHTITVAGKVHSLRVQPRAEVATLECTLRDETGTINLVFLGRKHVAGIEPGTRLVATGMVGRRQGRLEIINPDYEFRSA